MSRWLAAVAALALVGWPAAAQKKDKDHGPKLGDEAPAFTLKDQDGKQRSLAELTKKGKVALVFFRSADW
jgi:cytochrome oxidase Cu insertion factor (SCO1/SenC/PrrC family)